MMRGSEMPAEGHKDRGGLRMYRLRRFRRTTVGVSASAVALSLALVGAATAKVDAAVKAKPVLTIAFASFAGVNPTKYAPPATDLWAAAAIKSVPGAQFKATPDLATSWHYIGKK